MLALPKPDDKGPPRIPALPYAPSAQTAALTQTKPLNAMQKALVGLAANLPEASGTNLQAHLATLRTGVKQAPPEATVPPQQLIGSSRSPP